MKKIIFCFVVALMATMSMNAQQIAVVKGSETKLYNSLKDALNGAADGSVVYLPGGGFPIADSDTIKKKLTIIGISHKANSDNADGSTRIIGNLFFGMGSSGSSIMGCYLSGNINIGDKNNIINDISIKYCNINALYVKNASCNRIEINQNYIRGVGSFAKSNPIITNNVLNYLDQISGATIKNNFIVGGDRNGYSMTYIYTSEIIDNIIFSSSGMAQWDINDCQIIGNVLRSGSFGYESIAVADLEKKFVKNAGISSQSDFHFNEEFKKTEEYKKCEGKGIYGGTGFPDGALPPVPYISDCDVDEQTDAEGKLNIRIKVKAVTE